jgi:putative membrane protein
VDWRFVIPLGVGILTAIVVGAKTIPPLMEAFPVESRALFFGLVAASLVIPWRRAENPPQWGYLLAVVAGLLAFFLVGLPVSRSADPGLLRVFLSASVAICAMILPGVSGAFLLKVLGIYEPTLEALSGLDVLYVGAFVLGAGAGITAFSKLLDYLLTRHHDLTMLVLVGVLAGSLRALWPWLGSVVEGGERVDTPAILLAPPSLGEALTVLGVAAVGFAAVSVLTWWGARREAV